MPRLGRPVPHYARARSGRKKSACQSATNAPAVRSCFARFGGFLEKAQRVVQIDDLGDHRHDHGQQFLPTELLCQLRTRVEAGLDHVEHEFQFLVSLAGQRDCLLDGLNRCQDEGEDLKNDKQSVHCRYGSCEKVGRPTVAAPVRGYAVVFGCAWLTTLPIAVVAVASARTICWSAAMTGVTDASTCFATAAATASAETPAPAAATSVARLAG